MFFKTLFAFLWNHQVSEIWFCYATAITALTLLGVCKSQAATKTWDAGGGDQLWSTANNWSTDGVPASGDTIVFGTSFASGTAIQLNGNRTANDLSITSATNFSLNGNILTLSSGDIVRTATFWNNHDQQCA
ncbi:MAG: hypothetical protein H8M99_12245 [Gloeobacteraceae cyanobacterium ES-bin-144]|nr:hypothetical protein [Verrucomicrobiales bacterium]